MYPLCKRNVNSRTEKMLEAKTKLYPAKNCDQIFPTNHPPLRGKAGPLKPASSAHQWSISFVMMLYSPSCFGQETAKEPFGLRVKLPRLVHCLPHTVGVFTPSLFIA